MDTNSFSVIPMGQQLFLDPGEVYSGSITVANLSSSVDDLSFQVNISPYSVIGSEYSADFLAKSSHTEIVDWITIENPTGVLAPNESKVVNYTITVPEDAAPGGQYAAFSVISNPSGSNSGGLSIGNVYEIASLIYANISGAIHREGTVLENSVPGFSVNNAIKTTAIIENKGNTHEDAIFSFALTNAITGETIYPKTNENAGYSEIIMPDTTREITRDFTGLPIVGVVKVNQTIRYNDETYVTEQNLIICPIWLIILILALISGLIAFIASRIKHHETRKRATQL